MTLQELAAETLTQKNRRLRQAKCRHEEVYSSTVCEPDGAFTASFGDYPGLDIKESSMLSRSVTAETTKAGIRPHEPSPQLARQDAPARPDQGLVRLGNAGDRAGGFGRRALAALVVIVMAVCCEPKNLARLFGGDQDQKTEMSMPHPFEDVFISDLAPQMKLLNALGVISQFAPSEESIEYCAVKFIFPGSDRRYATGREIWRTFQRKIKILWYGNGDKLDFGENLNFAGRSLAVVDNINPELKPRMIPIALPERYSSFSGQVGSQLRPRSFRLIFAEGDKTPSDNCENATCERSDGGGSRVKSFSDLPEKDQGYVIGGAVFLAGLCVLAYLAFRRE